MHAPLKVTIITVMRDEHALVQALASHLAWASQWILVNTGEQAALPPLDHHNVEVIHHPLPLGSSFDQARAQALGACEHEWALILDTDERVPEALVAHIDASLDAWTARGVAGVWMARQNHVWDVPMRSPNQWPDIQMRLVRVDAVTFPTGIHQKYTVRGEELHLEHRPTLALQHFPYRTTRQFLDKLNVYTTIEARDAQREPHPPSRAARRALVYFAKRYFKRRGVEDGEAGLHFCLSFAFYQYVAEVKAWEAAQGIVDQLIES